jgi:hypothetical protein
MADFDAFKAALTEGLQPILKDFAKRRARAIGRSLAQFVRDNEADLTRWTAQLEAKKLTRGEFDDLVKGQGDLFQVRLLTEAGIAKAEAQALREQLLLLVVDTAVEVFL